MLICPQCQFENPDHHRFCQQCGTSLVQRACPTCGADAAYTAEHCPSCGARIGIVWLAIVQLHQPLTDELSGPAAIAEEAVTATLGAEAGPESGAESLVETERSSDQDRVAGESIVSEPLVAPIPEIAETAESTDVATAVLPPSSVPVAVGQYLDPDQRYQVLAWLPPCPTDNYLRARVLDCKPLQISRLDALAAQSSPELEDNPDTAALTEVTPNIPTIAEPYLLLPSRLGQVLPTLHDCWQTEAYAVVLVEDRSEWPTLLDSWETETTSMLEVLHWLHEMVVLWSILESWNYNQSLLEPKNLRLDEDEVLCLEQLYPNPRNAPPTLIQLSQVWQIWLERTQTTLMGPILDLFHDLQQAIITTPAELRSRIEAIAQDMQQSQEEEVTIADTPIPDTLEWYGTTIPAEPTTADLALESACDLTTGPLDLPDFDDFALTPGRRADFTANLKSDPHEAFDEEEEAATVALPMRLASIQDIGRTDVGCKRQRNEDYFSILSEQQKLETPLGHSVSARGVYVLCDGMGGHASGEVASTLAADTLRQFFLDYWFNADDEQVRQDLPSRDLIIQGINLANQAIYEINQENASAGSGRMGTTLVLLLLQDSKVAIAHVGDSRLYRVTRKQALEQLTIDHEVGQQEIQRGVDPDIAYAHADAYQLTQALGPRNTDFIHPDIRFLDLTEDTLFMLCSDGLSDNDLVEEHWQTHLLPLLSSRANLGEGAQKLIDLANQYNGHDNITVLLVRVKLQPHMEYLNQLA